MPSFAVSVPYCGRSVRSVRSTTLAFAIGIPSVVVTVPRILRLVAVAPAVPSKSHTQRKATFLYLIIDKNIIEHRHEFHCFGACIRRHKSTRNRRVLQGFGSQVLWKSLLGSGRPSHLMCCRYNCRYLGNFTIWIKPPRLILFTSGIRFGLISSLVVYETSLVLPTAPIAYGPANPPRLATELIRTEAAENPAKNSRGR